MFFCSARPSPLGGLVHSSSGSLLCMFTWILAPLGISKSSSGSIRSQTCCWTLNALISKPRFQLFATIFDISASSVNIAITVIWMFSKSVSIGEVIKGIDRHLGRQVPRTPISARISFINMVILTSHQPTSSQSCLFSEKFEEMKYFNN